MKTNHLFVLSSAITDFVWRRNVSSAQTYCSFWLCYTIRLKNTKYCATSCALTDNELTLTSHVRYNGKESYFPEANIDFILKLCCSSCPTTSTHLSHVKLLKEHCNVSWQKLLILYVLYRLQGPHHSHVPNVPVHTDGWNTVKLHYYRD